jgi:hypothetical protein
MAAVDHCNTLHTLTMIFFSLRKGVSDVFLDADFGKNNKKIPSRTVLSQIARDGYGGGRWGKGQYTNSAPTFFKKCEGFRNSKSMWKC